MSDPNVLIRIGGEGGEGVISTGELLSVAAARSGLHIMTYRTYPAEIKGGLAQFQAKLSVEDIHSIGRRFDHLMAFNQEALDAFHDTMQEGGWIYYDPDEKQTPNKDVIADYPNKLEVPLNEMAKSVAGTTRSKNMVALGFLGCLVGLDRSVLHRLVEQKFKRKGDKIRSDNQQAVDLGWKYAEEKHAGHRNGLIDSLDASGNGHGEREIMVISGNQAAALGAIAAGCNFIAGYPITPASSILEFLAKHLPRFGGSVVQAEDEIAALAACLGASFAGAKAITCTSGPGLMLMTELMALGATAELPVVIADIQRGGPSTGLPTKQEQSDLSFAIFGSCGDVPKIVVAPARVGDCFYAMAKAFNLAEQYQTPVLFLSDTSLAVRTETIPVINKDLIQLAEREIASGDLKDFKRYRDTETGVSPTVLPGTPGGLHIVGGLEHSEDGTPTYTGANHAKMNAKRFRKLETLKKDIQQWHRDWFDDPEAEIGVISWGSTRGVVREAREQALALGIHIKHFHPRIVHPLPEQAVKDFFAPCKRIVVIEENYTGQYATYLRATLGLQVESFAKAECAPLAPEEVLEVITEMHTVAV